VQLLGSWDYRMDADSGAATIWNAFWTAYLDETFNPWWKSRAVPVGREEEGNSSKLDDALGQDLETWTLHDPTNRAFSAPGVGSRNAADAQKKAFHEVVAKLYEKLGGDPNSWSWGRVHPRVLENLAQITGLDYGPRADGGDANTPLAAAGFPSTHGPSWRMVVDWGARSFRGVYPGGQSENPASAWYTNRVDVWWNGLLDPMLSANDASSAAGVKTWSMNP
jgi:penicillin amidase